MMAMIEQDHGGNIWGDTEILRFYLTSNLVSNPFYSLISYVETLSYAEIKLGTQSSLAEVEVCNFGDLLLLLD